MVKLNLIFHSIGFFVHDIIIDEAQWIKYQVKSRVLNLSENRLMLVLWIIKVIKRY